MTSPVPPLSYPTGADTLTIQCVFESSARRWSFTSHGENAAWVVIPAGPAPSTCQVCYQLTGGLVLRAVSLRRKGLGLHDTGLLTLVPGGPPPSGSFGEIEGWSIRVASLTSGEVTFSLTNQSASPQDRPVFIGLSLTAELSNGNMVSSPDPQMELGSLPVSG